MLVSDAAKISGMLVLSGNVHPYMLWFLVSSHGKA
jgi:hypothetical protein